MADRPNMGFGTEVLTQLADKVLMGVPKTIAMAAKAKIGLGNLLEKKIIEASRPKYGMDEAYPGELFYENHPGLKPLKMEGRATFAPLIARDNVFLNPKTGKNEYQMSGKSLALPGLAADAYNTILAPGRAMRGDPNFDAPKEAVNMGLNLMGGGAAFGKVPAGSIGMLAGRRAKFANLSKLDTAKSMAEQGIDRSQILKETQWFKAPDGEWKFEIPDNTATYSPGAVRAKVKEANQGLYDESVDSRQLRSIMDEQGIGLGDAKAVFKEKFGREPVPGSGFGAKYGTAQELKEIEDESYKRLMSNNVSGRTDQFLNHPELYENYPDIGTIPTHITSDMFNSGAGGEFGGNYINLNPEYAYALESGKSIELHELQHAIQKREGFAKGASPSEFIADYEKNRARLPVVENYVDQHKNIASDEARWAIQRNEPIVEQAMQWAKQQGEWTDAMPIQKKVQEYILDQDDMFKRLRQEHSDLKYGIGKLTPYERYRIEAGETEARAVQTRMNMTPEQREARPFWLDYDVPEAYQIVRFGNSGKMDMTAQDVLAQESKGLVPPVQRVAQSGLVVANKYEKGIIQGKPGDLHFSVHNDPQSKKMGELLATGFADSQGNFYDRNQALEFVRQSNPDQIGMQDYLKRASGLDAKDYNATTGVGITDAIPEAKKYNIVPPVKKQGK
tara:strand:- start:302 stop:2326 length:2025 start_codon:yes stop_codon:yes gene_type:complete